MNVSDILVDTFEAYREDGAAETVSKGLEGTA